ncbi:MAG: DUF2283 domain-containing protein [Nanoarchaeota archaeon]
MKGKMTLHYDQESDYLEIFIEDSSPTYGQEVGEDITVFRNKDTEEVVGIGILNFKKRTKSLASIQLNLPFNINFSDLKV